MELSQLLHTFVLMNMREASSFGLFDIVRLLALVVSLPYLQWAFGLLIGWVRPRFADWINNIYCSGSSRKLVFRREKINQNYRINGPTVLVNALFWYLNKNKPEKCKSYESIPVPLLVNRTNQVTGRPETLQFEELIFPSSTTKIADDIYICLTSEIQGKSSRKKESSEESEESDSKESKEVFHLTLSSRRHYADHINLFMNRVKQEYEQDTKSSYIKIYDAVQENNSSSLDKPEFFMSYKTFDNLFFKDKDQMLRLLQQFNKEDGPREQFRKKFGCPNNLSFMLHGPPGTGKTSCIKAIASYLRRDVVMVKLNSFKTNTAFADIFTEHTSQICHRKKIFVFEEIDCCFKNPEDNPFLSRKDKSAIGFSAKQQAEKSVTDEILMELVKDKKGSKSKLSTESILDDKLNHEGVLNALDGPRERNGRVCIFTTNYIDRIDEAYLRYGRMNMVVHLDRLLKEDVQRYFQLWFDKPIPSKVYSKMNDGCFTQAELGQLFDENLDRHDKIYESLATKKA